jgi:hypothetical protein
LDPRANFLSEAAAIAPEQISQGKENRSEIVLSLQQSNNHPKAMGRPQARAAWVNWNASTRKEPAWTPS